MSLKKKDRIKIFGWPMLAGLEDGETYEVVEVKMRESFVKKGENVPNVYIFQRVLRSGILSQKKIGHYAKDVDLWIQEPVNPNNSKIEIVVSSNDEKLFPHNKENETSVEGQLKIAP